VTDERVQKLLQGALKAARSGQTELAQRAFREVLKLDPRNETAWVGLATVTESRDDKLRILKKVLELNPDSPAARQALARLGVGSEPESESAPPEEEPIPEPDFIPAPAFDPDEDEEIELPSLDDLRIAGPADDEPPAEAPPSGGLRSLRSLRPADSTPATPSGEAVSAFMPDALTGIESMTIEEVFAHMPKLPAGEDGIPLPRSQHDIDEMAQQAYQQIQQALSAANASPVTYEKKSSGRAGEWEYRRFVFQIGAGVAAFVLVLLVAGAALVLNNPDVQAVLFEPTMTPSPTSTATPTSTPGVTNTPSPMPSQTATPQPTLPITVTPDNDDPNFPPRPTDVYFSGVSVDILIDQSVQLMEQGRYDEAFNILREEATLALNTGDFAPHYFLSYLYLERDEDTEGAQAVLDEWLARWGESSRAEVVQPQLRVAQARIDLLRAEELLASDDPADQAEAEELLTNIETQLTEVVEFRDANFAEAYVLLAERLLLLDDPEAAIALLDTAILENMYGSPILRLAKARLLVAADESGEALYELNTLLYIHPWQEEALAYQPEVALLAEQPGLAVLYSEQYLLYYPGSATGWYWLGRAREAENKDALALTAYERGLQAGENAPGVDLILPQRAKLYARLGNYEDALADLDAALERSDEPELLLLRSEIATEAGEYELALEDLRDLEDTGALTNEALLLREVDVLLQRGEEGDIDLALEIATDLSTSETTPEELQSDVQVALARVYLEQEDYNAAVAALENPDVEIELTPEVRYLRAQIYAARAAASGNADDFNTALADYEVLLTLGQVVPYPFLDDVTESYDEIVTRLGGR